MKSTSTPPKIDNHKHYILGPLVTYVRIIFRKGLNRVHNRGTFSVNNNNNKYKYALHWFSLIAISSKYAFFGEEIRFSISNL